MAPKKKISDWAALALLVVCAPVAVAAVALQCAYALGLSALVWATWCRRGRDILFVYASSSGWAGWAENEMLPRIRHRSVVLDWSCKKSWIYGWSLAAAVFRHFGGRREFCPIAIRFRPFRPCGTYRFFRPLRLWKKHGNRTALDALQTRFFHDAGP